MLQLFARRRGVLDGVVQDGGQKDDHVRHAGVRGEEVGGVEGMVDVGRRRGVLALLALVLLRRESGGAQEKVYG